MTAGALLSDRALYVVPLAGLVTGVPIFTHIVSPTLGFGVCFLAALTLANFAPAAVPATLLFSMAFQNAIVAIVTPLLGDDKAAFNLIRSYNFLMTVTFWLTLSVSFLLGGQRTRSGADRAILAIYGVLPVVGLYFLIGAGKDLSPAITYLRNVLTPILCLQIGLIVGRHVLSRPEGSIMAIGWMVVLYGFLEVIFDLGFLRLFNGDVYLNLRMKEAAEYWVVMMKQTGFVVREPLDMLRVTLFNTPLLSDLNISLFRLHGPNFHPISYAYALAFFALVGLTCRRPGLLIATLPLMVFIGSKGAVLMLLLGGGAYLVARSWPSHAVMAGFVGVLCVYIGVAIVVGMRIGDFHVLGLFGCLDGFLANPLGHGLGVGGNLTGAPSIEEWQAAQHAGKSLAAVESGIGVLLYQMGVGALVVLAVHVGIVVWCWRRFRETGSATLGLGAFAVATILANAILQEEALFSPLALGSLLLFVGHAISRSVTDHDRDAEALEPAFSGGSRFAIAVR